MVIGQLVLNGQVQCGYTFSVGLIHEQRYTSDAFIVTRRKTFFGMSFICTANLQSDCTYYFQVSFMLAKEIPILTYAW